MFYTLVLFDQKLRWYLFQDQFGAIQLAVSVTTETLRIGIIKAEGLIPVDMSGTLGK